MKLTEVGIVKSIRVQIVKHRLPRILTFTLLIGTLLLLCVTLPHSFGDFLQSQPVAAAANPIQIENSNPGTPGWDDFSSVSKQDAVESHKVVPSCFGTSLVKSYPILLRRYDLLQKDNLKAGKETICDSEDKRHRSKRGWKLANRPLLA